MNSLQNAMRMFKEVPAAELSLALDEYGTGRDAQKVRVSAWSAQWSIKSVPKDWIQ